MSLPPFASKEAKSPARKKPTRRRHRDTGTKGWEPLDHFMNLMAQAQKSRGGFVQGEGGGAGGAAPSSDAEPVGPSSRGPLSRGPLSHGAPAAPLFVGPPSTGAPSTGVPSAAVPDGGGITPDLRVTTHHAQPRRFNLTRLPEQTSFVYQSVLMLANQHPFGFAILVLKRMLLSISGKINNFTSPALPATLFSMLGPAFEDEPGIRFVGRIAETAYPERSFCRALMEAAANTVPTLSGSIAGLTHEDWQPTAAVTNLHTPPIAFMELPVEWIYAAFGRDTAGLQCLRRRPPDRDVLRTGFLDAACKEVAVDDVDTPSCIPGAEDIVGGDILKEAAVVYSASSPVARAPAPDDHNPNLCTLFLLPSAANAGPGGVGSTAIEFLRGLRVTDAGTQELMALVLLRAAVLAPAALQCSISDNARHSDLNVTNVVVNLAEPAPDALVVVVNPSTGTSHFLHIPGDAPGANTVVFDYSCAVDGAAGKALPALYDTATFVGAFANACLLRYNFGAGNGDVKFFSMLYQRKGAAGLPAPFFTYVMHCAREVLDAFFRAKSATAKWDIEPVPLPVLRFIARVLRYPDPEVVAAAAREGRDIPLEVMPVIFKADLRVLVEDLTEDADPDDAVAHIMSTNIVLDSKIMAHPASDGAAWAKISDSWVARQRHVFRVGPLPYATPGAVEALQAHMALSPRSFIDDPLFGRFDAKARCKEVLSAPPRSPAGGQYLMLS